MENKMNKEKLQARGEIEDFSIKAKTKFEDTIKTSFTPEEIKDITEHKDKTVKKLENISATLDKLLSF